MKNISPVRKSKLRGNETEVTELRKSVKERNKRVLGIKAKFLDIYERIDLNKI